MDEKKKLLIGIGIAIVLAAGISGVMTMMGSSHKSSDDFVLGMGSSKKSKSEDEELYDLDVEARKIAEEYKPLDLKKIEERVGKIAQASQTIKSEEIKNDKGEVVGTKEYKDNGEIVIKNLENGSLVSTETIEKESSGKFEGKATLVYTDGVKQMYTYKDGVKKGEAQIVFTNGDNEVYTYKKGVPQGEATYTFANGDKEIYNYKDGVIDGDAKYIYSNGSEENYKYVNGERQ